jgi:hypothetical protein
MLSSGKNALPQWVGVAQRLQMVRRSCGVFLDQWAASRLATEENAVDRVAADISTGLAEIAGLDEQAQAAIADPENHDWSILYRGSVLDD